MHQSVIVSPNSNVEGASALIDVLVQVREFFEILMAKAEENKEVLLPGEERRKQADQQCNVFVSDKAEEYVSGGARLQQHGSDGADTQREVKLEITGNQNEELIKYLDDILLGLRYQDGHYDLVKLNDEEYQEKLQIQSDYWEKLKTEIGSVRNKGYKNTDIVNMSEIYFS